MNIVIRKGTEKDMPKVLELIKELADFEKEPDAVIVTKEDLIKDGFCEPIKFKTFVAELEDEVVGMALFYPRYSTWKGATIHLEDLIVTHSKRRFSIGSMLYKEVLTYAYEKGVQRVEWVVLDWNQPAIDFYKKSGAKILNDWRTVQMDRNAIQEAYNK